MTDGGSDHIEFLGSFEALDDTRQQAKVLYPLPEILLLCLCAVLGGADSWVEVALYGQRKLGFLRRLLPFAHGVPSHDQLGNVFARLDAQQFQSCFIAWVERFTVAVRGVVAVDGKTLRRSFDRAAKQGPIHMISAWSSQQRLVLGQCKVADKSNEITAIPELLQLLELHGAVVTIDAMGCQRTIAAQIIDQKGKYSVYRCGSSGHNRNGVLRNEVWEDSGEVRMGAHGGMREPDSRAAARGNRGAPAGALLPQNAWQGGRARAAAERETASGACEAQGIAAAPAGTVGAAARQREANQERRRRRGAAVSNAGQQAMAGASMDTCRCRSKHTTLERRRCPACGDEYGAHGSEDSEQLEIEVRAYRRVIKRRRYRRSCQCAAAPALLTAAAPPRLIPKGILGISVWVTVLIDKYLLYRPTYRLLADLRAHGLDLAQGTVTDGMRRLAPLFAPLREALIARSRTDQHWHADETRWQVFEADSEDACQRWCLWVFWSAEVVVFTLDPTRSARVPKQHFATVTGGVVSVDRYSAYKRMAKDTALVLSFCWVHMRRDFITIANERDDQEEWAEQWLADIAALYHLNDERLQVRAEPTQYAAADAALRAGVQAMQERRERELAQQPKLPAACAKVLRSLRNHWQGLTLFVEDPDLPMDNNQAERALRGPVVGRKNYYGSGAQWSGELSAALFSLFHTLERWRINPRTWLTEYLNACAVAGGRVPADFQRFLPWNRRAARVPRASPAQVVDSRAA